MITVPGSPIARILALLLWLGPLAYLVADGLYAARGWNDPTAAVVHVVGAIAYTFVVLKLVTLVHASPGWASAVLVAGVLGVAGNVAYGFNTIHVSLGDTDLVDAVGAAVMIKPLGLCFPLALVLSAVALAVTRTAAGWVCVVLGVAALTWPVAHIADIGWLAVAVNLALVVAFAALAESTRRTEPALVASAVPA